MRAIGRRGAVLMAAVFCAFVGAVALAADTPDALAGPRLLSALREGGLILYFRHTSTDFGQNDDQMSGYEDCARQRNLTDRGRDEARQIGAAIKRLDIPVGEVLASPFCRTRETAQLIFGRATVSAAVRGARQARDRTSVMRNCANYYRRRLHREATWPLPVTAIPLGPSPMRRIWRKARRRSCGRWARKDSR